MRGDRAQAADGSKQRLYRIGVFFLTIVVTSAAAGILIAQLKLPKEQAQSFALPTTVLCLALSYLLAYRPGWMYNYLVEGKS